MSTSATIAKLERAYQRARRAENKAIEALPARAGKDQADHRWKAQADRCWALADATNAARRALEAAHDAAAGGCPYGRPHNGGETCSACTDG